MFEALIFLIAAQCGQSSDADSLPAPVMTPGTVAAGGATVVPDWGISGQFGTWTVRYVVGEDGIAEGGGLRVQLPDAWHSGIRNSANRLQATDPTDDHYVSATCTAPDVELRTTVESESPYILVKHAKPSLDGRSERYVFVVRVAVTRGRLNEGDVISVIYGDRSHGSRGYRASAVATGPEPVLIALDPRGDGRFQLLSSRPSLTARPGPAAELRFHGPSSGVTGRPASYLLALVDTEDNPAVGPASVRLHVRNGRARVPAEVVIPADEAFVRFDVVPSETGYLRIDAAVPGSNLSAISNPMDVRDTPTERTLYWGDLHSHTRFSWDGVGDNAFAYARNVAGLDFYAVTDHAQAPRDGYLRGLSEAYWDEYTALTEQHNDPGHFVTLHAYECSFGRPFGHHNVFFRDKPGPIFYPSRGTLPELWSLLAEGQALTIPHHTGKFPNGVDFSIHDPRFRRNFEIYSGHGLSEVYNPEHPLAFEHSLFTGDSRSLDHPSHAQDAWRLGLQVSTIASSDDHRARPGLPHYGLAAVRARELTRMAVFDALYDRQTYGTTGAKIILEFTADGTPMGQVASVDDAPELTVQCAGTDTIARIEVLRLSPGDEGFRVVHTWTPDSWRFEGSFSDEAFVPGAIYYCRVRQDRLVRNRLAMAWSSPIWTSAAEADRP